MWTAPGELKIDSAKPRAYESAMGIESMGVKGEERRVQGKMRVGRRCGLLSAALLPGCSGRLEKRAA